MKFAAALVSCALCVTAATGGAWLSRPADVDYGPVLAASADRYAVLDDEGEPARWYVTGAASGISASGADTASDSAVTRIPADSDTAPASPWKITVTYSLDGPNVDAATVSGASGLVGIYIDVKPATDEADKSIPVVAFTVPTQVASDISADKGVALATQGSDTVVAAAGKSGSGLSFSCYMNAKDFTMSAVALASLPVSNGESGNGTSASGSDAAQLAATAATLVDSLTDAGSGEHQQLVDQLKALRDNERKLDQSVVAERKAAHKQTFEGYMAAYVGSYTNHLSGSIGTSTQLPALMGTAGELSGDTPLAQAVIDLANAVNNVSAAHMHAGAVDALDEVIRRIQQQGTTGLIDDLTAEAAEEATKGSKQYSEGQSQLSAAMIPYSMKYTDVYTANLSALTGGTSSGASAYAQQAIAETNGSADLKDAQSKVDAAMDTLAAACEHTGKSQALKQIVLRFSDQFEGGDSADAAQNGSGDNASGNTGSITAPDSAKTSKDGGSGNTGAGQAEAIDESRVLAGLVDPQSQSFYGRTKAADAKRKAQAALKQAEAAKQQQSQDANASLVDDTMSMSAGDVMSYANGLTSALGGGKSSGNSGASGSGDASAAGQSGQSQSNASGSTGTDDGASTASGKSGQSGDAADDTDSAPVLFGFGKGGTLLTHDMSTLIGETVELSDAGTLIAQAITQLGASAPQSSTGDPRYLLVIPTV